MNEKISPNRNIMSEFKTEVINTVALYFLPITAAYRAVKEANSAPSAIGEIRRRLGDAPATNAIEDPPQPKA
jgi:hypothetical protein